jgi:hypothetical protein
MLETARQHAFAVWKALEPVCPTVVADDVLVSERLAQLPPPAVQPHPIDLPAPRRAA